MVMQTDRNGVVKPVCWAACVASLVNCCQGRKTTNMLYAYNVVELMGTGYVEADTSTVLSAIQKYGINYYRAINGQASYSTIVSDISAMRPIIMGSISAQMKAHMTLVTGYYAASQTYVNGGGTIVIFNPATGNRSVVTYSSSGTIFTSGAVQYTWNRASVIN